jgi:hypothetical protein
MTRPITRVLPAMNVTVTLAQGERAARAYTLMRPQSLPVTKDGQGRARVVVPRVDEYEVVVFEQ